MKKAFSLSPIMPSEQESRAAGKLCLGLHGYCRKRIQQRVNFLEEERKREAHLKPEPTVGGGAGAVFFLCSL